MNKQRLVVATDIDDRFIFVDNHDNVSLIHLMDDVITQRDRNDLEDVVNYIKGI